MARRSRTSDRRARGPGSGRSPARPSCVDARTTLHLPSPSPVLPIARGRQDRARRRQIRGQAASTPHPFAGDDGGSGGSPRSRFQQEALAQEIAVLLVLPTPRSGRLQLAQTAAVLEILHGLV